MHPLLLSLKPDYPGLEAVKAAAEAGDTSRALDALVGYFRSRPEPDPAALALPDPSTVAEAEQSLRHAFVFYNEPGTVPGEGLDWTWKPGIDWEWTWALNRHGWWPSLASAYLATGDERYMQELDMEIRTWVGGHPPSVDDYSAWRTIEAGIRSYGAWPAILSALKTSPSISRDAWLYYLRSIQDHAEFLLAHPKGGNWLLMETNGVLACGLLFPEFKRSEAWVQAATEVFEREMQAQVHPDGAQVEYSTGYHFVCLRNFEMALDRLERAAEHGSAARLSEAYRERLKAMWEHVMYMLRPDGRLPMLNDADNRVVAAQLQAAGEKHNRSDFIYAATQGQLGRRPAESSHRFAWARRAVMRSGWEAEDLYAFFETAPFGYGHQHEDALTFELYAYGQPLLGAMGKFTYAKIPLRQYLISSEGHNVLLVDGQGQDQRSLRLNSRQTAPRASQWIAEGETDAPWQSGEALDVAYGCYEGPWTGGLAGARWERWLAFQKPDPAAARPGLWVLRDRVSAEDGADGPKHDLTWLLHFFPGEVTWDAQNGARIQTHFGEETGNLLVIFAQSATLKLDAAHGQANPPRGWYSDEYGKIEPAWEVRATCQTALPYQGYLLCVPYRGESAPQVQVEALEAGVRVRVNGTPWDVAFG